MRLSVIWDYLDGHVREWNRLVEQVIRLIVWVRLLHSSIWLRKKWTLMLDVPQLD